ncbi:hypothetical protein B7R21_02735 [Subtercola boreus]|uniref:Uncharacterized protein n=1 Tax=Subtercola boreus TaxID=120213 RepID=A0A3E0W2U5_9MICO|nr:hypothetical protein [Subtercola boreus]RFA16310.1 hypothetical protein B7R21_02735 [Subtercola boreus]
MTDWHARFERDARFRHAVEAEYDGAYDVGDALWWLDHPSADCPSGEPAPRRALAGLQRAAFARPSGAGEEVRALAAQSELDAIGTSLESERAETERALAEALATLDARPAMRRRTTVLLAGAFIAAGCLAGAAVFVATTVIASQSAAGGAGIAADGDSAGKSVGNSANGAPGDNGDNAAESAADGAGTAAADGGSSYSATGGDGSAAPTPRLTAAPYPNFPPGIGADSYSAVFSHGQLVADLPPSEPAQELLVSTFRALNVSQNSPGAVYAAISSSNQVCLVVYGNPVDYGYTCDDVDRVATRGLQVSLATRDYRDPDSGLVTPGVGLSVRWLPDGALTLDSSVPYDRD